MGHGRALRYDGFTRLALAILAAFALLATDMSTALAQNQACGQIVSLLRGIERNSSFTNYQNIVASLRQAEARVRQDESTWIRGGCQQAYNATQTMTGQCRALAQQILRSRAEVEQLTAAAREGQTLTQNRERLLQDSARFNCSAGNQSGATFGQTQRQPLMNQLFGNNDPYYGDDYIDSPYNPWAMQATRRTVCVRTCDGFYWPISFSTTDDFIAQDAIRCHEMCPGTEVLLFSYRNPGEEPEDMISLSGMPYRSTPYAFLFRQDVAEDCSCQRAEALGAITMASDAEGHSRAAVAFDDLSFPLPLRDPRRSTEIIVADTSDLVDVPLPRPRPRDDGTIAPVTASNTTDLRIVNFGDRPVRIVGPETPYVPQVEGAS